jgi:hypothetical protein
MTKRVNPFRRRFTPADIRLFEALVGGLVGKECRRLDRLYGGAFSLHFGEWRPTASTKGTERGDWIVTVWGSDTRLIVGHNEADDRFIDRSALVDLAEGLVGAVLEGVDLDSNTLDLRLRFRDGAELELALDPSYPGDAWTVSLPTEQTIALSAKQQWSLEDDVPA